MGKTTVSLLVTFVLFVSSVFLALQLRETGADAPAGASSRFAVQSAHAADGDVVPWVLETYGATAAEGAALLGVSDTSFEVSLNNPLVEVRAEGDLAHPDRTTIRFGDVVVHVEDGLAAVEDVRAALEALPDEVPISDASELLTGVTDSLDGDGGADEEYLYLYMDPENQYAMLRMQDATGLGDVMLEIGRLVEVQWERGAPMGVTITNPVAAFSLGRVDPFPFEYECNAAGCVGAEANYVWVCAATCVAVPHPGSVPVDSSLIPPEASGHFLTVRAHDHPRDGVDVRLLDGEVVNLRNTYLDGDPTTGTFTVRDTEGDAVLRATLTYPTMEDATLRLDLEGEAVGALGQERIGEGYDLDAVGLGIKILGHEVTEDVAWGTVDLARGVIVEKWTDANGDLDALLLSSLLTLDPIFEARDDAAGKVTVAVGGGLAFLNATGAELREKANQTQRDVDPLDDAILQLVGDAPGTAAGVVLGTVEFVLGEAGCEELEPGCVLIRLEPTPELPSEGDVLATVGGVETTLASVIAAHVNLLTGLVLTTVDELAPGGVPPVPPVPPVPGPTEPSSVEGLVLGELGSAHASLVATMEQEGLTPVAKVELRGQQVAEVRNGRIVALGGGAPVAGSPLFQVSDAQGWVVQAVGPLDAEALVRGAAYSVRVEGAVSDGPIVLQPGLEFRRVTTAGIGEVRAFDQDGISAFSLARRSDGTVDLDFPALGESASVPGSSVVLVGRPVEDASFTIRIAGADLPEGIPYEVTIEKGPLADVTGQAEVPPGLPALAYRFLDGPSLSVSASDGAGRVASWSDGDASWLSGMRDVSVAADFESEAFEAWHLVLRGAPASDPLADGAAAVEFGYDGAGQGRQFYSASFPAAAFANVAEGTEWWFAIEVQEIVGGVRHATVADNGGEYYRFRVDTAAPGAFVTAPSTASGPVALVKWGSGGDAGSGLAAFHVEARDATANGPWTPWIQGRPLAEGLEAQFTGAPGHTLQFRAKACDATGNCGASSPEASTQFPASSPNAPGNTAPTLAFDEPEARTAAGMVRLSWSAADAQSEPIITLYLSPDGGQTFPLVLYSGTADEFTWDTSGVPDGDAYVLKIVADDGALQKEELYGPFTVDNGKVEPVIEGEGPDGGDDGAGGKRKKKGSPGFDAAFVLAAGAATGLALLRRRRRD